MERGDKVTKETERSISTIIVSEYLGSVECTCVERLKMVVDRVKYDRMN